MLRLEQEGSAVWVCTRLIIAPFTGSLPPPTVASQNCRPPSPVEKSSHVAPVANALP